MRRGVAGEAGGGVGSKTLLTDSFTFDEVSPFVEDYFKGTLAACFSQEEQITAAEALQQTRLSSADRVYLGSALLWLWRFRYPQVMPDLRYLFACDCAERILLRERQAGREPDSSIWATVAAARDYAQGKATWEQVERARLRLWEVEHQKDQFQWNYAVEAANAATAAGTRYAARHNARHAGDWPETWTESEAEYQWALDRLRAYLSSKA